MKPVSHSSPLAGGKGTDEQGLLEDIAYFEARLEQMGDLGDCAYERAMSRIYEGLVKERRQSLASLRADRGPSAMMS